MTGRDDRIYQEAAALWRALYDEAPPAEADGQAILDLITHNLPAKDYARLASPFMRPATVVFPKTREN